MKKLILIVLVLFFYCSNVFPNSFKVYFEKNNSSLSSKYTLQLDSFANEIILKQIHEEIIIIGYTDSDGSYHYNQDLALNRAKEVRLYLKNKGINNRFSLISKGEIPIKVGEKTEQEKQINRKVEIKFEIPKSNLVFKQLEKPAVIFKINPHKDTLLICPEGTQIGIPKSAFLNFNPRQKIEIKVQEYYTQLDCIKANLTTNTQNGEMLESKGMINIEAWQGNVKLELKNNANLDVVFASSGIGKEYQIFYSQNKSNEVVWELGENKAEGFEVISVVKNGDKFVLKNKNISGRNYDYVQRDLKGKSILEADRVDNRQILNENALKVNQLGWINCDRFYKIEGEKVNFVVKADPKNLPSINLVFEEINSIMPYSYRENDLYYFENIPINMKVKIVSLYQDNKKDFVYYANEKAETGTNPKQKLNYHLVNVKDLKL